MKVVHSTNSLKDRFKKQCPEWFAITLVNNNLGHVLQPADIPNPETLLNPLQSRSIISYTHAKLIMCNIIIIYGHIGFHINIELLSRTDTLELTLQLKK